MFKDKLYFILDDIGKHKRLPSEVMEVAVSQRLDLALTTYIRSLEASANYASKQDSINVLKKMSKQGTMYDKSN